MQAGEQRGSEREMRTNKGWKRESEGERELGTSGRGKMDQERLKGAQQQRWKTARKLKKTEERQKVSWKGSGQWVDGGRKLRKKSQIKHNKKERRKKERNKERLQRAEKRWGGRNILQAAFQSIIISWVLDVSKRVQFCSGYHYHHSYNHNQGNSCVARWKGGWQRVMEEYKMSDRRYKGITECNHGEMHERDSDTVGGWEQKKDRGVENKDTA